MSNGANNMPIKVGDKVKLTGKFLRNTGQFTGSEGLSQWIVQACPCSLCEDGRYVAVNEPSASDPDRPRHFNARNLYKVGTRVSDNA